jgi:hypothetical protein
MKLYKVYFEVELMVLADSDTAASFAVLNRTFDWTDEIRNGDASAEEVGNIYQVSEPNSLPWVTSKEKGEELTCAQILANDALFTGRDRR